MVLLRGTSGKLCRNRMRSKCDSIRLESTNAVIRVDAGLPAGKYIIQLSVIDENGNRSKPAKIKLKIFKRRRRLRKTRKK